MLDALFLFYFVAIEVLGGVMTKSFRRAYNDALENGRQPTPEAHQPAGIAASVNEARLHHYIFTVTISLLDRRHGI